MNALRWSLLGLLLALGATVLIYWPGVQGGFVLDDYANIVNNAALSIHHLNEHTLMAAAFSSDAGPLHRPLSLVTFALNEYFFGPAPYSMKVTNIALHAFNGIGVFIVSALILTTYRSRFRPKLNDGLIYGTALAITTAWLLLPINLTAVLYVVQRMTSLSATFVLIGVALYLWGRRRMLAGRTGLGLLWTALIVCGGLAVLAKEDGALLAVYLLILEWVLFDFRSVTGTRDRRLFIFYLLGLVVPGFLGLIWLWPGIFASFQHSARPFTMVERLLTEPRVIWDYLYWSPAPNLNVLSLYHDDYPLSTGWLHPLTTLTAPIGLVALGSLAVWQRKKRPLLALGILWFLGGQLMTASIFDLELVFEQRNYLPDFGLLLAVFGTVLLEPPVKHLPLARRALVIGLIALYGVILALRVQIWANPVRFAVMSAALHPRSPRATYGLGRLYAVLVITQPHDTKLQKSARRALEKAAAVPHASILPDQALLIMTARLHHSIKPQWWAHMDAKLARRPASAQDLQALRALVDCELSRECAFPISAMQQVFNAALARNPHNATLIGLDANWVLNVRREPLHARDLMLEDLKLAPAAPQYRINLIKLDIALDRFADARAGLIQLSVLNHFGSLDLTLHALKKRLEAGEVANRARIEILTGKAAHKPSTHP